MFHPIFNANGRISVIRVICLVIIAICMATYGILMLNDSSKDNNETFNLTERNNAILKEDKEHIDVVKNVVSVQSAVEALSEGTHYLASCGLLNRGFVGCEYSFSENILSSYTPKVFISDEGYSLELKSNRDLHCNLLKVVDGTFSAFDAQGQLVLDCANDVFNNLEFANKDYTISDGDPAPSGLDPLKHTAEVIVNSQINKEKLL